MAFWLRNRVTNTLFCYSCHSRLQECNWIEAFKDGFDKGQPNKLMPRFKMAGQFPLPQGFTVAGERVYLPKIGTLRFRKSREIEGVKKYCLQAGGWLVRVHANEQEVPTPVHASSGMVGIDLGVAIFAHLMVSYKPLQLPADCRSWPSRKLRIFQQLA